MFSGTNAENAENSGERTRRSDVTEYRSMKILLTRSLP